MEHRILPLWPGTEAPYTADCPGQAQPSLKEYAVPGAPGAVVVIPGGGYNHKAAHEGDPIAEMLNRGGVSAYVLDYRVKPCHMLAPLADASRAIRRVRGLGYDKVAVLGFSAGGHLACAAATLCTPGDPDAADPLERLSARPDAFIPCYAVVSFVSYRHQGSVVNLLGPENAANYALLRRFSAELQVTGDTPPAFIWHTAADEAVPVENSLNLAAALSRAGVPYELHIFPRGRHGLGLAEGTPEVAVWAELLQTWLRGQGFAARADGE